MWLLTTGHVADIAAAVLVLELAALRFRRAVLWNGLSGLALIMALRGALTGAGAAWILIFLTAGFAAHLIDLRERLKTPR